MRVPERIAWAVEQLAVEPSDRLLEIGCGHGVAVQLICDRLDGGRITAIDRSAKAIDAATQRNESHVAAGTATFHTVALEDADLPTAGYDKIFAINVNLFWVSTPTRELAAIREAVAPAGALCLFYEPPSAGQASDLSDRIVLPLVRAGFDTRTVTAETSMGTALLAVIGKPADR